MKFIIFSRFTVVNVVAVVVVTSAFCCCCSYCCCCCIFYGCSFLRASNFNFYWYALVAFIVVGAIVLAVVEVVAVDSVLFHLLRRILS